MGTNDYNSFAAQFIYPVYKGVFVYKVFTAFLSPLYFFKLRFVIPDFNSMPMNRPEWNSI